MTSKRELRRQEVEAHNRAHEQRLVEIQARALFRYLGRLGGERKRRRRLPIRSILLSSWTPYYSHPFLELDND